jgi:tetratricopeptide (TPR) repeat protein
MRRHRIFYVMLVSFILLEGCVTFKNGPQDNPYDQAPIVHQTNGKDILTRLSREGWIQKRKTASSDQMRLYSSLGTREWDVAINDARAYLQDHPKDRVALTVLATALAMKQNYSLAAYYGSLLEKYYPDYPETANLLGLAKLNRTGATYEDYQEAAAYFERAFDSHGNQVASGLNLGHLHLEMGNAEGARDVFKIVADRCGYCVEALLGYGIASSRLQDFKAAGQTFNRILENDPGNEEAQYYQALVAVYGDKDHDRAINLLSELVERPGQQNLEIKRKANFLLRRLEARTYATERSTDDIEKVPETVLQALDSE